MLAVTGSRTSIVRALTLLLPEDERVTRIDADLSRFDVPLIVPAADRFLLAAGVLYSKRTPEQTAAEIGASLAVNCVNVIRLCEHILETREHARVCVIASESAYCGSHDQTYAAGKAGALAYIGTAKVHASQLLTAVSPPIIADSGMTARRHDYPHVIRTRRHVYAAEVAAVAFRHLYHTRLGRTLIERM